MKHITKYILYNDNADVFSTSTTLAKVYITRLLVQGNELYRKCKILKGFGFVANAHHWALPSSVEKKIPV